MTARWRVTVRGRVQGVGYRWFVRETADRLRVNGWVRNLPGGEVELEAQGERAALEALCRELGSGHSYARVDGLERLEIPATPESGRGFLIRH